MSGGNGDGGIILNDKSSNDRCGYERVKQERIEEEKYWIINKSMQVDWIDCKLGNCGRIAR